MNNISKTRFWVLVRQEGAACEDLIMDINTICADHVSHSITKKQNHRTMWKQNTQS